VLETKPSAAVSIIECDMNVSEFFIVDHCVEDNEIWAVVSCKLRRCQTFHSIVNTQQHVYNLLTILKFKSESHRKNILKIGELSCFESQWPLAVFFCAVCCGFV